MKITFLGTGTSQGVPVITCQCRVCQSSDPHDHRLRTSALIETDQHENILIDIGPDFREQMLRAKVMHLEGILITHAHRDHVGGIDDIRAFNYTQGCKMQVFANQVASDIIHRDYKYIFEPHEFAGLPEADVHVLSGDEPFFVASQQVVPVKAMHKTMPVLAYRIGDIGYITDANYIAPDQLQKFKGVRLLVVNSLRKQKHFSHYCLSESLQVIEHVSPEVAYLTHMSHEMGLYNEEESLLPPHVHFAYDGLTVKL